MDTRHRYLSENVGDVIDIGDISEDVHTYIPINEADLASKKVCLEGARTFAP